VTTSRRLAARVELLSRSGLAGVDLGDVMTGVDPGEPRR
jgi:hypothetical protein